MLVGRGCIVMLGRNDPRQKVAKKPEKLEIQRNE